jgi:hypothetical protein
MKNSILLLLLFCTLSAVGQKSQELSILKSDSLWGKEIIQFPIDWAPGMTLKGFEDIRFAPQWDKQKSTEFWSLALAWKVESKKALTASEIINNMEAYFNGLMAPRDTTVVIPRANFLMLEKNSKTSQTTWTGKMKTYDDFHTKEMITLNLSVIQYFCKNTKTAQVIFRFSLHPFEHPIWESLNAIEVLDPLCR